MVGDNDPGDKKFVKILRDLCDVVRDAEKRRVPELAQNYRESSSSHRKAIDIIRPSPLLRLLG